MLELAVHFWRQSGLTEDDMVRKVRASFRSHSRPATDEGLDSREPSDCDPGVSTGDFNGDLTNETSPTPALWPLQGQQPAQTLAPNTTRGVESIQSSAQQPRPWYPGQPVPPTPETLPTQGISAWRQTVLSSAQQHAHPSDTENVPTLFDRMETNYPYQDYTIHSDSSRAFIQSRMPEYFENYYVSSRLWKWEAESGMSATRCMSIAMPHVPGDVWIALRLSYPILSCIGHSHLGDVTNFTWEEVQSLFRDASRLLDTSERRKEELKAQLQHTRCVWTRAQPGDDIFLGFCVGEHVGNEILKQCTRV